jgi:hypothetical protein
MTGRRGAQYKDLQNKVAQTDFEDWSSSDCELCCARLLAFMVGLWLLHRWMDVGVLHGQGWMFVWREYLMIEELHECIEGIV